MRYRLVLSLVVGMLLPVSASAHILSYGTVSTELHVTSSTITLSSEVSQNINVYGVSRDEAMAQYQKYFSSHIRIQEKGADCPFFFESFDPSLDKPHSVFGGYFQCPSPIADIRDISIHSELFNDAFVRFDHFMTLTIGNDRYSLPFSATKKDFPGDVIPQHLSSTFDYFLAVAARFIWMGMQHIFTGYDHILFLISVVLLARSFKQILLLVTSFTIAHSITLILASFHIVTLSSHIVEPAIAITILYMAIRNLVALKAGSDAPHDHRVPLTFAFGLVHGLGFASALAETTIPQIFFVPALLTFNVGIELGQLSILAVVLPLLWYVDSTQYRSVILRIFSYIVCTLAVFWLIVRIFF